MKTLLTLLALAATLTASAQQPKRCVTCGVPVGATYYNFNSPSVSRARSLQTAVPFANCPSSTRRANSRTAGSSATAIFGPAYST